MLISLHSAKLGDWEQLEPPRSFPNYVGELSQAVSESKAWIQTGGVSQDTVKPPAESDAPVNTDGESEVDACLLLAPPCPRLVCHTLDKCPWSTTPAVCEGQKIWVAVSYLTLVP